MQNAKAHYLYRIVDGSNGIIYVGETNNLSRRIDGHRKNFDFENDSLKVEYVKFNSEYKAKIYEIHYIALLKPIFNIKDNQEDVTEFFSFPEIKWIPYIKKSSIKNYLYRMNIKEELIKTTISDPLLCEKICEIGVFNDQVELEQFLYYELSNKRGDLLSV